MYDESAFDFTRHPATDALCESLGRPLSEDEAALLSCLARDVDALFFGDRSLSDVHSADAAVIDAVKHMSEDAHTAGGPTLTDALSIGNQRPFWSQTPQGQRMLTLTTLELGMLPLRAQRLLRHLRVDGTPLHLALTVPAEPYPMQGVRSDALLTLLRLPTGEDALWVLYRFWEHAKTRNLLQSVIPVKRGALAATLCELPFGCAFDPGVLRREEGEDELAALATAQGYLVAASEEATRELLTQARSCGLCAVTFARLTEAQELTLQAHKSARCTLPLSLLRTLTHPSRLEITPRFSALSARKTSDRSSTLLSADGWEKPVKQPAGEPVAMGDMIVLHTTIPASEEIGLADVQAALMQSALRLVAAGGDFNQTSASVVLTAGKEDTPSALWSLALGWYNALKAWPLPTSAPVLLTSEEAHGELTVCLSARALHISAERADRPVCLRLFAAAQEESLGLPDAAELRAMLSLTSQMLADGRIVGLRPLWDRPLGEALSVVKDLTAAPSYENVAHDVRRVCGLLIRSDLSLTDGVLLGTLPPVEEPAAHGPVDRPCSLLHRPTPRVLIPLLGDCPPPEELVRELLRMGAEPHPLPIALTHEGCTALADAIWQDDIILLRASCEATEVLLSHRRVDYALRERAARHVSLLAIGGAADALAHSEVLASLEELSAPDLALRLSLCPDGIDASQLSAAVAYYR